MRYRFHSCEDNMILPHSYVILAKNRIILPVGQHQFSFSLPWYLHLLQVSLPAYDPGNTRIYHEVVERINKSVPQISAS